MGVADPSRTYAASPHRGVRTWVAHVPGRELLETVLTELLGEVPRVDRTCPDCDRQHGKPVLDHPTLHVSTATSAGLSVVAVADAPVGVDVERVDAARFDGFAGVAQHRAERGEPAVLWTRKEAALKATGEGLRTDPRTVDVSRAVEPVRGALLLDVAVPEGWVAAVAVLPPGGRSPG